MFCARYALCLRRVAFRLAHVTGRSRVNSALSRLHPAVDNPKYSQMRSRQIVAVAAVVMAGGCAELKDLTALSSALEKQYHVRASVDLNNGSHLRITYENVPTGAFAPESVARFAKGHYHHAERLEDITIAFAQVARTGPLTVTRTDAPSKFSVRDLR